MKKICYVSSSRADYGIVSCLLKHLEKSSDIDLQLIATGSHLSKRFGYTINEILNDGLEVHKKIDLGIEDDSDLSISKYMGKAIFKLTNAFKTLQPDGILILGDRYEILSVAIASQICNLPLFHIHGGETTEGAFDESFRHAITKMSYWHFVSHETHKKRVIQLGEDSKRVFNVGSLGVENIRNQKFLSKPALEEKLGFKFLKKNALVTFHPETLNTKSIENLKTVLKALSKFKSTNFLITEPNHDPKNSHFRKELNNFIEQNPNSHIYQSLGKEVYLSTMKNVDFVIGNSSSGIIEAPSFSIPTINLGDRQKGRYRAKSIIDCPIKLEEIISSIKKVYSKESKAPKEKNPFEGKETSRKILKVLTSKEFPVNIKKKFFDL